MSPDPIPPVGPIPVPWYDSQKFKAYALSLGMLVLGWLSQCLATNVYEWRALAIAAIGIGTLMLRDWASPAVVSPLPFQNTTNLPPWKPGP